MNRYRQLIEIVRARQPQVILEVGTWNGGRALEMLEASPGARYIGFDIFEDGNAAMDRREFNVKRHFTLEEVGRVLGGKPCLLIKGDTRNTLPAYVSEHPEREIDLAWIDGGHSVHTVMSDFQWVNRIMWPGGLIIMDDYYTGMPKKRLSEVGCNRVMETLPAVTILPVKDGVVGGGQVQMVMTAPMSLNGDEALISLQYRAICQRQHVDVDSWGSKGGSEAARVEALARIFRCGTILDYGCGKGGLAYRAGRMGFRVNSYDPAVPQFSAPPAPADLVVCRDVLEHIEPDRLDNVLAHIRSLMLKAAYFVIPMRPANSVLPDGRNAHLIVGDKDFWLDTLARFFHIDASDVNDRNELRVVVKTNKGNDECPELQAA